VEESPARLDLILDRALPSSGQNVDWQA
jgi:hypothetical protein